jgi:glutamate--cysteine ligase
VKTVTVDGAAVVQSVADAEGYIARVCFKTGPPLRTGVELEWTVHHVDNPARELELPALRAALGPHAPGTLDPNSPMTPLPGGSLVTVEPGGQVELSTPPATSLAQLYAAVEADIAALDRLLATQGLRTGSHGIDPYREPVQIINTPRYAAMAHAFEEYRPYGRIMRGSTAGLQICVDPGNGVERWRALHTLGPALLAAFANSRRHAGRDTRCASARMCAWLRLDPARTAAVWRGGGDLDPDDAAAAWARYAVHAPLLCLRRPGQRWNAPPHTTFADWINGALRDPPTRDDLAYHLTTLFPPVRPRGYLEVRYFDAQPPGEWIAPVTVVTALFDDPATIAEAERRAAPAIDRWAAAASLGTGDPGIAAAARGLLTLALERLDDDDQAAPIIRRRLSEAEAGGAS